MSTSFQLVDPRGWEYDLQSVYSAYIGYFQINNIPWYEKSWGHLFSSFEEFLQFSWPCITVSDSYTGRAHIVTRLNSIGAFLKMIKTRFGEVLPQAPNILQVSPFEIGQRPLRHVSDYTTYKKLHNTLPAVVLSAFKARVRAGEPQAVNELWQKRDRTFLAFDFEWSERNEKSPLEWGYAAVRCGVLDAMGHWPPVPDTNYRKGHYIVSEYVDKLINKHRPTFPWQYAFGDSQLISKAKLPEVIEAIISCFASPDSETIMNNLVLVAHGISGDLQRLEEMRIKIPHNVMIIDTSAYERHLFTTGQRFPMVDPKTNKPRAPGSTLSLENLLLSFMLPRESKPESKQRPIILPNCTMHNSGNDAFMCLFALQMLLEPEMQTPTIQKGFIGKPSGPPTPGGMGIPLMMSTSFSGEQQPTGFMVPIPVVPMGMFPMQGPFTPPASLSPSSPFDLASEFGKLQMSNQSHLRARSSPGPVTHLAPGHANATGNNRDSWAGSTREQPTRRRSGLSPTAEWSGKRLSTGEIPPSKE